jgi:hypothetical protein
MKFYGVIHQEHGMRDGVTRRLQRRYESARTYAAISPARRAPTPDEKQDQLQTWEGEGGSTAPAPDGIERPPRAHTS